MVKHRRDANPTKLASQQQKQTQSTNLRISDKEERRPWYFEERGGCKERNQSFTAACAGVKRVLCWIRDLGFLPLGAYDLGSTYLGLLRLCGRGQSTLGVFCLRICRNKTGWTRTLGQLRWAPSGPAHAARRGTFRKWVVTLENKAGRDMSARRPAPCTAHFFKTLTHTL